MTEDGAAQDHPAEEPGSAPCRIFHLGVPSFLAHSLVDAESKLGLSSELLGNLNPPFLPVFPEPLLKGLEHPRSSILVVHGLSSFSPWSATGYEQVGELFGALRELGTRIVLWVQPSDFLSFRGRPDDHAEFAAQIQACSDAVVSAPSLLRISGATSASTTEKSLQTAIPFALSPQVLKASEAKEYQRDTSYRFRVLVVPFQSSPEDIASLRDALASLRSAELVVRSPEDFLTFDSLVEEIRASDAVVDLAHPDAYGPIGALALSLARPVFSGSSAGFKEAWPAMELCPVIHCSGATAAKKLQSCFLEPRTLRDFGRRGLAFAQQHHDASRVAQLTQRLYQQLIS